MQVNHQRKLFFRFSHKQTRLKTQPIQSIRNISKHTSFSRVTQSQQKQQFNKFDYRISNILSKTRTPVMIAANNKSKVRENGKIHIVLANYSHKKKSVLSIKNNKSIENEEDTSCKYEIEGIIGKGTFGIVYSAHHISTTNKVAIKKVYQDKRYKNRQLIILNSLTHKNIIKIIDHYYTYQKDKQYLNIVMPYYHDDLYSITHIKQINQDIVKIYMYQLFSGLSYLACLHLAHRDIKPHNILIDQHTHKIAICDFGSAKIVIPGEKNLSYICARCYRAPQLIFGSNCYDCQVDVWSAGCIFVEIINASPLFVAKSSLEHLIQIIKVMGTPSKQQMKAINPNFDTIQYQKLPFIKKKEWKNIVMTADVCLLDLINKIMVYSPLKRYTANQILAHNYFDTLRNKEKVKKLQEKYGALPFTVDCSSQIGQNINDINNSYNYLKLSHNKNNQQSYFKTLQNIAINKVQHRRNY